MSDNGNGFWKNKLFGLFKKHRIDFPKPKIVAKAECCVQFENNTLHFSIPIIINKDIKRQAYEALYAEVYDTFLPELDGNLTKKNKQKKKSSKPVTSSTKTLEFEPLADSNIGHKILQKMGWSKGQGLGTDNTGMKDPIPLVLRKKRSGLGN
ncbi:MAG: hypothetical protein EBU90_08090 [Proteobacteria bacterium]|nr:hypothetical protein [Pseudomonadota bacterium]NBP15280.1 hypothetical protein [bacterium]